MQISLQLPSKGLVYSVPQDKIEIRTMKGKDEKLLAECNFDNADKKYAELLKNVVTGIDAYDLTLGDRLHMLLWERINSHSPIFPVELVCSKCEKKSIVDLDLSKDVPITKLPDDFKEPKEVTLKDGTVIKLRLFRVADEIKIIDSNKNKGAVESYNYKWALSLVDDKTIPERVKFIENLDTDDLMKIKEFHEQYVHGPDIDNVNFVCPKCEEVGKVALPFLPSFLIPRGGEIIR